MASQRLAIRLVHRSLGQRGKPPAKDGSPEKDIYMRARGKGLDTRLSWLATAKINKTKEKLMSYNKILTDKQNEIISENAIREAGKFLINRKSVSHLKSVLR